ncbi:DUF6318 family protein [Isoptericola sp. b515]|uniref:DUF6318 family protein n=1 Tax=Isoptericola sp. b515 TaxID=3064652 RepID=UPI002713CD87|nr:DUF6318 family protein [Isoptericola sp. b515]MDO8148373.1 DUF6318 family protein [Isoptericola sp. b515]
MARTPRHHSSLRRLVPALVVLGLLAGCTGGDPKPEAQASEPSSAPVTTAPSEEPTPSPSPSPTGPTKPERPAAMDKKNAEGAAAAVEYILGLEQPMMVSGDTTAWERHSHRSCDYCESRLDQAQLIAERGDLFEGGGYEVRVDKVFARDVITGIWPMNITVREHATSIAAPSGEVLMDSAATTAERRAEIALRDGTWVLVEIAPIPNDAP